MTLPQSVAGGNLIIRKKDGLEICAVITQKCFLLRNMQNIRLMRSACNIVTIFAARKRSPGLFFWSTLRIPNMDMQKTVRKCVLPIVAPRTGRGESARPTISLICLVKKTRKSGCGAKASSIAFYGRARNTADGPSLGRAHPSRWEVITTS